MTRPVRWSADALADLADQIAYIAAENPSAAHRVADALDRTALALGEMPTGRAGRVAGTYEKSVTGLPYIVAYGLAQVGGEEIVAVLRVIHTARDWTTEKWPD
jgi:plasmid stabilization system protein ParE